MTNDLGSERIGLIGLLADEEGHAGRRSFGGLFIDKGGAGTRAHECFDVFPVFEKADVFRSRGLEGRHIAEQPNAVLGVQQYRPTQGAQRIQRKWAGAIKKASVCHLGSVGASRDPISSLASPVRSPPAARRWQRDLGRREEEWARRNRPSAPASVRRASAAPRR